MRTDFIREILSLKLIFLFIGMGFVIALLALILLTGDDGFSLQDMSSALMIIISAIMGIYLAYELAANSSKRGHMLRTNGALSPF